MQNKSVMSHSFARTPQVKMPRSVFNRSHGYKCTMDADYLIPFYVDEVLPGDSFNLRCTILMRLNSPTIKPFMDNCYVDTFWFFVPNRILWSNFIRFMGERTSPADSISYYVPYVVSPNTAGGGIAIGSLYDYMGLPAGPLTAGGGSASGIQFDNLHGRGYNQTWNQWFRDENLQNAAAIDVGDGPDTYTDYVLRKRGKRYDYFTSALPYPQKGATSVTMNLGTSAVVKTSSNADLVSGAQNALLIKTSAAGGGVSAGYALQVGTGNAVFDSSTATTGGQGVYPSNLYADLSSATAATINSLRESITLQQFLERDARGGTRYPELVLSHFGVSNPDSRVQRPELLATYSTRLNITPVAQTTPKPAGGTTTDQGNLSGFGTASAVGHGFTKSFTEHGILLGLISVRADLTYQQGMDRMWDRRTRYDFYWPEFANLGEQAIKNKEIYANLVDGTGANQKDGTFGYIPRYDEYRFKNSKICGNMRSYNGNGANSNTLDVWHLSEAFSAQPTLGDTFIQSAVPLDRVIAVPAQDHFILDAYFDLKCARVMPVFGIPGLKKL